jgi:Alr-MurF fusion protein
MQGYAPYIIAEWIEGRLLQGLKQPSRIDHILFDSRKLAFPDTTLFFAITAGRRNGHEYIYDLYNRGVRAFAVSEEPDLEKFPEALFIIVQNTVDALQKLSANHRKEFNYPVIGITGSNGKTVVKEWLHFLLSPDYRIVRSPKSYNSQIGVPLSIWQMEADDQLGIFEAGISQPGEMEKLEKIIQPTLGIFTNIGEAHSEGFNSQEEKISEKCMLFRDCKTLIYCKDHTAIDMQIQGLLKQKKGITILTWGESHSADIQISAIDKTLKATRIEATYKGAVYSIKIPFTDAASLENAMHCLAVMIFLTIDPVVIAERMKDLPALAMRLELKEAINKCSLINDSYNADWSSLQLALDFLAQQQQHQKRTVILSDILQSGKTDASLYGDIAKLLKQQKIQRLIGIGSAISANAPLLEKSVGECVFYPATDVFLEQFHPSMYRDETILLKGSRAFEFERIAQLLEQKIHQTVLEINLSSVTHNLKQYQKVLMPRTRLMAMVKAFSYGAGSFEIANLLQFHQVDYLAVAYTDEGVDLRKAGIRLPIMVMNAEERSFSALTNYDLQPELFSFEIARNFDHFLQTEGITDYPVHIKFDTGMHRLGFAVEETAALGKFLTETRSFRVQTVFSHLVASEDPAEDAFTREQAGLFQDACNTLEQILGYGFTRHLANTSAIQRHPDLQLDMVRLGIGLYGVDPSFSMAFKLKEVSCLKTTVAQVRQVAAGQTVGYNRKGKLSRDSLIATIRIGYADGYPRSLGNGQGKVLIRGNYFPVMGSVCMDMTMVDITGHPEIMTDEEVIVFGQDLSVTKLAEWAGTIPYEILTGISQRVQRVYFEE